VSRRQWLAILALALAGLGVRYAVWEVTRPIRTPGDAISGYGWGRKAGREGIVRLYDRLERETREKPGLRYEGLDYMPGRLAVMTAWAWWHEWQYPGLRRRRDYYWSNLPPLAVNTIAELIAALAAAALVREVGGTARQALLAAVMLWFHPAVLVLGYGRPQWDTWLLPFFLGSLLMALRGRWALSGAVTAAGVMFKAQIVFGASVLPLFALFDRRVREAAVWLVALLAGTAVCLSPWLVHGSLAPLRVAIVGGVAKWPTFPPPYVRNVCTLASRYLGWGDDTRLFGLVRAESFFAAAAVAALVASALLASRLRGVHRLLTLVMPWFAFYLLMPRVHLRYIVWPVVFLSIAAVFARTYLACWAVLAAVSTASIFGQMVVQPKSPFHRLAALASATAPLEVWLILACTLVLVWRLARETRGGGAPPPTPEEATPGR
jgi:hypothetical protein